ncbi:phosphopantetheine-binding protein [Kitasatospora sp. NPDC127059]|uniref:phosphopantetheine-binding protein n=1 Tax=unclassified Kitasatospora TaxID=2633591 RepID=UPI00364E7D2C
MDLNSQLAAIWTELLKCDEVTAGTDFFECGGTSIVAVYLAADIQEKLQVTVDAIEIVSHRKFGDLVVLVAERHAAAPA